MSVSGGTLLPGASGLPSYASSAANQYRAEASIYNWRGSNTRYIRRGLARVAAGSGCFNVAVIGDSLTTGYNGTAETRALSFPYAMMDELALLGFPRAGDGIVPVTDGLPICPLYVASANWAALIPTALSSTGAGTLTFTSLQKGTQVGVVYANNGGAFTWTVDGVAQTAPVPSGATSKGLIMAVPQANTAHVVVITAAAANVSIFSVRCDNLPGNAGTICNVLSMGGSRFASGAFNQNWNDTSQYYSLQTRITELPTPPDMWLICVGGSDQESGGITNAATIAGWQTLINTLKANSPSSNILMTALVSFPNLEFTTWPDWLTRLYRLADVNNLPITDWNDRLGGYSQALADGMLGADNLHFAQGTQAGFGRILAQELVQ